MEEDSKNRKEQGQPRCAQCRSELALGVDVTAIRAGVIGPRGFVPLENRRMLCSEECLRQYVCNGNNEVEFQDQTVGGLYRKK